MKHYCIENYKCNFCYKSFCNNCKNQKCDICNLLNIQQIMCCHCNGTLKQEKYTLCYDCFVIAIIKNKIFYCYSCSTFCYSHLENDTHSTHLLEYNKKRLIKIAIKIKNLRKAFTLLDFDSDID